jgi:PPK2 family polyphosphate:nucleotide phosphotransferase
MNLKSPYFIKPQAKVKLSKLTTSDTGSYKSEETAAPVLVKHQAALNNLQDVLYASQKKAILIVLQGMDTAGKDGTIRHIFSGINPQGCDVSSFKVPTPIEALHDFLWRCQIRIPARGMIGIFNRSHYEDVLSPWVHGQLDAKAVRRRLRDINSWEQTLANQDVVILKFYLHISRDEQTERLQSRIDTPDKRWKLSPADFEERRFWPKYIEAYDEILRHTSPSHAPWFVIPSDHKWYRNVAISTILVEAMKGLNLKYPPPTFNPEGIDLKKESPAKVAKQAKARAGL